MAAKYNAGCDHWRIKPARQGVRSHAATLRRIGSAQPDFEGEGQKRNTARGAAPGSSAQSARTWYDPASRHEVPGRPSRSPRTRRALPRTSPESPWLCPMQPVLVEFLTNHVLACDYQKFTRYLTIPKQDDEVECAGSGACCADGNTGRYVAAHVICCCVISWTESKQPCRRIGLLNGHVTACLRHHTSLFSRLAPSSFPNRSRDRPT